MTKQEIELLIRMRSEADAALNKLGGGLRAVADDATKAGAGMDRIAGASQKATPLVDQIDKIVDKFTRDASEATRAAMAYSVAVEQIGGASRLTATQHAEVSRAVDKANSAYKSMGQEAPAHLRVLQRDLTNTATAQDKASNSVGAMLGKYLAIGTVVATVQRVGAAVFDYAGKVDDLSDQLDWSTDAVQRWTQAAQLGGTSMETIARAAQEMGNRLLDGNTGAIAALTKLGISYDDLRKLAPEEQFKRVVDALIGVDDKQTQTAISGDIFGRSSKELARILNDELNPRLSNATVLTNDQIAALERSGNAWEKFKTDSVVAIGQTITALGNMIGWLDKVNQKIESITPGGFGLNLGRNFANFTDNRFSSAISDMVNGAPGMPAVPGSPLSVGGIKAPGLPSDAEMKAIIANLDEQARKTREAAKAVKELNDERLTDAEYDAYLRRLYAESKAYADLAVWSASAAQGLASAAAARATPMGFATQTVGGRDVTGIANAVSLAGFVPTSNQNTIGRTSKLDWSGLFANVPAQLATVFASGGGASQIGGGVGSLAGGIGGAIFTKLAGEAIGKTLGSAIPVVGSLVGGFLGKAIGGLFGPSKNALADRQATSNIQGTQANLLSRYGSIENIAGMTQAGAELAAGWGHQGRAGEAAFNAQVKAFEESLQRQSALKSELIDKERDLASMESERAALVESLVPKWTNVKSVLDQYGISLDGAGIKVQQLAATDSWTAMLENMQLLERAGVDVGGMLFGMKDEFSKMVQESMRLGTEIPENMRPYIEELAKSGLLLDKNGEKITDLSNLKWGDKVKTEAEKTNEKIDKMTEGIQAFRDGIDEIVRALRELLPAAAGDAARATQDAWDRNRPTFRYDVEGDGTGQPTSTVDVPGAANGVLAGGPRGAKFRIFGEREPEMGGSVDFMSRVMAKASQLTGGMLGAGLRIEVVSVIDGKVAARALSGPLVRTLHERKLLP